MTRKLAIISVLFILIFCVTAVSAEVQYPNDLRKYVTDNANLFSQSEIGVLNEKCAAIEKSTGVEIAVITVQNTSGEEVIQYAAKTGELNGVGSAQTNDGIVILYSVKNRPGWAIATGRGAESTITDAKTAVFLRDASVQLRREQYFDGTTIILQDIQNSYTSQAARNETLPGTDLNIYKAYSSSMVIAFLCMAGAAIVVIIIVARRKR